MCLKTPCLICGGANSLAFSDNNRIELLLLFDWSRPGFKAFPTGSTRHPCFYATAAAPSEMRASPLLPLIFAFIITTFSYTSDARLVCAPCLSEEECEREPTELCMWGEARDNCNRRVCAKGPGERCGGPLGILGRCGEGMMCKADERCHGCSTQTFQCHP